MVDETSERGRGQRTNAERSEVRSVRLGPSVGHAIRGTTVALTQPLSKI